MRRLTCISALALALACLAVSCADKPLVGIPVETTTKPVVKNTTPHPEEVTPLPPPGRKSVMVMNPDLINRMPDGKDMHATAPPSTVDRGPNLMVPAPKPAPSE
jgi:hypothetical protein